MEINRSIQSSQYLIQTTSVQSTSEQTSSEAELFEQNIANALSSLPVDQLPPEPTQAIVSVFQQINLYALQSAEIGQSYQNREAFQGYVAEELDYLRTILEELAQDELTLFITIFQNMLQNGIIASPGGQAYSDANFFSNGFTDNSFENLFRIDVISQTGTLEALDLSGTIIDILSGNNNGSGFPGSLSSDLTELYFNDSYQDSQQTESRESLVYDASETQINSSGSQPEILEPPLVENGSNPPTIIELAG